MTPRHEYGRVEYDAEGRAMGARGILEQGREWVRWNRERRSDPRAEIRRQLDAEDRALDKKLDSTPARTEGMRRMRRLPASERVNLAKTAFHEAGHAVYAHMENTGIDRVWIRIEGQRVVGGSCKPVRNSGTARFILAGIEAERLAGFCERDAEASSKRDLQRARERSEDMDEDRRLTARLLEQRWPAVRALAHELMAVGVVAGVDAERIIARALKAR